MAGLLRRVVPYASVLTTVLVVWGVATVASAAGRAGTRLAAVGATVAGGCAGVPGPRQASNPLGLARAPGSDPLNGAPLFVDGPAHGAAAGAIARLLGIDSTVPIGQRLPGFATSESWQTFLTRTVAPRLPKQSPSVRGQILQLEKIASEPEPQRVTTSADQGTPAGIAAFVHKLFCQNLRADPGSVPVITTDFMHAALGGCPSSAQIEAYMPLFKQRVDAMVSATGSHRVVYLLEIDAVGSSSCIARTGSLTAWEQMLRYEVDMAATLTHAVVYVEGGYSDSKGPRFAARILRAADIGRIRGFFTNDTHNNWTTSEVRYGEAVSRLTHGAHFVINTSQNGRGPKLNPHPRTQGVEDLCNPPGRGLGPLPTTITPFRRVDALLWTHVPGISDGACAGGPAAGSFWVSYAISLAVRANQRLGPGRPGHPY